MSDDFGSWSDSTVIAVRELSPTVREITLHPPAGAPAWSVGSHLRVQVLPEGRGAEERCYSLIGLPAPGAPWRIAVKRVVPGRGGSAFMSALEPGQRLLVQPPRNHFPLPPGPAPTLLIAGGIGITPLFGMALQRVGHGRDVRMRYAARSRAELVYADELRAALGDRLATFASDRGERLDLDAEVSALAPDARLLVCGPLPLMHAAQEAWARAGRPSQFLRFETFGSGGAVAAEAFWVSVPQHGLRIEVPPGRTMLDALQDHGVELLADCLRGECGLCAVDVIALDGRIDHRDVFFSRDEQAQGHKLCACVSRVCGGGVVIDSPYRPDTAAGA